MPISARSRLCTFEIGISPFAFRINDDALPELVRDYTFDQPRKDRTFPLNELSEQEHRQALETAFGNNVIQGYPNVIAALKTGYASIGYERGRNKLVDLRKFLENKRMIIPEGQRVAIQSRLRVF